MMVGLLLRFFVWILRVRHGQLFVGTGCRVEPSLLARGGMISLGDRSTVRFGTVMMPAGGAISVGKETTINHYCVLHGGNGITIGNGVLVAPRVSMFAANHEFADRTIPIRDQGMTNRGGIHIGDDVWIGTGAILLDGVQIGRGAVIGAGSVVTKSVAEFTVVVGNPARKIAHR